MHASAAKTALLGLLLMVTPSAWAEWVKVGESGQVNKVDHYINFPTVRIDGNFRKFWVLQDGKQQRGGALSFRARLEIDCKEERIRLLALSSHTGPMATGDFVSDESRIREWREIAPGSIDSTYQRLVCSLIP